MSKVSKGLFWSSVERFSVQGTNFLLGILLARIISPESYGLIVMIQVLITISQVFIDGGFANALIQKQERTETDYSTVFLFNLGIAIFIYVIFFFAAPLISSFYSKPELTKLTRVLALSIIISSFSIIQKTRLTINLDFKTQAKAGFIAVLISGALGLYAAYSNYEVWALVIQSLSNAIVFSVCLWLYSWWWPRLSFSYSSFKGLFKFGSKLLVSNLVTNLYVNLYNIIIGKYYAATTLAYYNRAFTFVQYPSSFFESILNRTFYPIECEMQNDRHLLVNTFYKFAHFSCFIIMPAMILLMVLSDSVVSLVLTDKWLPIAPLITILGFNFMWFPLLDQLDMLLIVTGRTDLTMKATIYKRIFSFILLVTTIPFGVKIICWGLVLGMFVELTISYFFVRKEINISIKDFLKRFYDIFVIGILLAIILLSIKIIIGRGLLTLILGILAYLIVAVAGASFFKMDELSTLNILLHNKLKIR